MFELTLNHFLFLGAVLFALGIIGAVSRRSAIAILMCIELMFNGVNITLAALNHYLWPQALTGQVFIIFIITVAAAEAAVGLALVIAVYRRFQSSMADDVSLLNDAVQSYVVPLFKMGQPLPGQDTDSHHSSGSHSAH